MFQIWCYRKGLWQNISTLTEVETSSIVEKGYWDDFFQLEGGHYVHMKLQFILSEDERNRIRNVVILLYCSFSKVYSQVILTDIDAYQLMYNDDISVDLVERICFEEETRQSSCNKCWIQRNCVPCARYICIISAHQKGVFRFDHTF